jgi:hypothetical protein
MIQTVFSREWLRDQIKACGLSIPQVADKATLGSPQSLYDYLSGKRSLTSDNLCKVVLVIWKTQKKVKV